LLLCYKPVQHVTVLNTVGNCNTVVSIVILYYNTGWFKKWTQFRTSIFPELYMLCEWST